MSGTNGVSPMQQPHLCLEVGFATTSLTSCRCFNGPGCSVGTDGLPAGHLRCCDGMNLFQCKSGNIYGGAATTIQSSMDFSFCPLRIGRATTECDGGKPVSGQCWQCQPMQQFARDNFQG